jgi:sugar lactone lactonase YvrE
VDVADGLIVANDEICILGEGPVWDATRNRVLWLDIRRGLVLTGTLQADGSVDIVDRTEFGQTVGAIGVAQTGEWIVAGAEELLVRRTDGSVTNGPRVLPSSSGRRLNDGKVDPAGRFVVGSLSLDGPSDKEILVRVAGDGSITELDSDLTLANGMAWTANGSRMYSIDTLAQTVYLRSYNPSSGAVGPRQVFLQIHGFPDGMCLDAKEHLWIAIWGSGEVRRYSPEGELVATIKLPAPHVSSVAFAGPVLETLVITTATQDLSDEQLAEYPDSGRLFTVNAGVLGLPETAWRGPIS